MKRLALFLLLCLTVAGCGTFSDMSDLQTRLANAGLHTRHSENDETVRLEITATAKDAAKTLVTWLAVGAVTLLMVFVVLHARWSRRNRMRQQPPPAWPPPPQ